MKYILIIVMIISIAINVLPAKKRKYSDDDEQFDDIEQNEKSYPYQKKYLLTKNEYYFYKKLKVITDELDLQVLAKIRLADLVEVKNGLTSNEWSKYFSKIKSKHIDFAITDNMNVILLIELDDSTHKRTDRTNRDEFVNNVLHTAGYVLVRTYGDTDIVEQALYDNGYAIN